MVEQHEKAEERTDRRVARVLAKVHNLLGRRKGQRAVKPDEFMPRIVKPQTPDELRRTIHQWHRILA